MTTEHRESKPLAESYKDLPNDLQQLLPEANMGYYASTDEMHCGPGEGGSKFEDPRVRNIFDVIAMRRDLPERVAERADDREALKAAGAPESAFLPSTKGPGAPAGLPEALYYKVEGVEGRLGIIKAGELAPDTKVLIRREKGKSDPEDKKGYAPVSFAAFGGAAEDMPKTDFATIIVGRSGGETGANEVWTVHPGAPIRPAALKELPFTADLRSPEETPEGEKQGVRVMTVAELMEKAGLKPEDYIKINPGELEKAVEAYDVRG